MQQRTDTLTVEALATYATWSDARLLHAALRELPFSAQSEMDAALEERGIPPIGVLFVPDVEEHFATIWRTLQDKLVHWRDDLTQRLYDEICIQRDYCTHRDSQDAAFWSDVIAVIAGILGDLGFLALSLLLVRRLLDQLCGCG